MKYLISVLLLFFLFSCEDIETKVCFVNSVEGCYIEQIGLGSVVATDILCNQTTKEMNISRGHYPICIIYDLYGTRHHFETDYMVDVEEGYLYTIELTSICYEVKPNFRRVKKSIK